MPEAESDATEEQADRCGDCGQEATGNWVEIPYQGATSLFTVSMCGCSIEIRRERTTDEQTPCPFCDHIPAEGLPGVTHTHETVETIW